jgi:hypothetical protein
MLFSNACLFVLFSLVSLSANAETVRGAQRELTVEDPVVLGAAENYAILAATGISSVPASAITGNIAVSPIGSGAITGFNPLTMDSTGAFSTSSQITGKAYAADYATPTPAGLTAAVGAMRDAYLDAEGRSTNDSARINYGAGILGGNYGGPNYPLTAGVYTFGSDVSLTANVHFTGTAEDIFIIQMTGNLIQDANFDVILDTTVEDGVSHTPLAKNIFWQVAGYVSLMAGAHMEGILLVKTKVDFITGSTLNGRVLAQTACNLQSATIVEP